MKSVFLSIVQFAGCCQVKYTQSCLFLMMNETRAFKIRTEEQGIQENAFPTKL